MNAIQKSPSPRSRKAKRDEAAEIAKLDYEGVHLDPRKVLGTTEEWLEERGHAHDTLYFAITILGNSASRNADVAAEEWDAMVKLQDCIVHLKQRYQNLAELLSAAEARVFIGMARAAYREDAAAGVPT